MEFFFAGILLAAVFAFIAYPILNPEREQRGESLDALEALYAQRDSAYVALRDLDFDFQLGKLSQNDYQALRERYKTRAALALQQIDAANGNEQASAKVESEQFSSVESSDDPIEREVVHFRKRTS